MEEQEVKLTECMRNIITLLRDEKKYPAACVYRSTLNSFCAFARDEGIPIGAAGVAVAAETGGNAPPPCAGVPLAEVYTAGRLKAYQEWLRRRKAKWNTVSTYMRTLRAVYNRICVPGSAAHNPKLFDEVYTKVESKTKRALDGNEMGLLMDAGLGLLPRVDQTLSTRPDASAASADASTASADASTASADASTASADASATSADVSAEAGTAPASSALPADAQRALAYFVLMFYFRGMPFIDLAYLRKQDLEGDKITYCRHKTGKPLSVSIPPEAACLFDAFCSRDPRSTWLFPILDGTCTDDARLYDDYRQSLRRFNGSLRQVASVLLPGVKLSSYTSRHTWATLAFRRGMLIGIISKALGHSSIKVTETYLKPFEDAKVDAANAELIVSVRGQRGKIPNYGLVSQGFAR